MTLFLSFLGASVLGTFCGNLALFWLLGRLAQGQERRKLEELKRLQQGYLDMVQRERDRLEKYAEMEG